jgi:uncharacterized FAD-dependent dehydrogenase
MVYDVVIVGAGAAGLLAAMELSKKSKLSILLIEQVKRLHDSRNVSNGWFGGSAKSDVRIFEDINFGGQVQSAKLFKAFVSHLKSHMTGNLRPVRQRLGKRELKSMTDMGFEVFEPQTYILSADKMIQIEGSVQKELQNRITIRSNCRVEKIDKIRGEFHLYSADNNVFVAKKCILALGRGGANWATSALQSLKIDSKCSSYELGVRLEFPEKAMSEFSSSNFRVKFGEYRTSLISCRGIVEMENVDDFKTSNIRIMSGKHTHSASLCLLKTFESQKPLQDILRLVKIANVLADEQLLREPVSKLMLDNSILSPIPEYASLKDGLEMLFKLIPSARRRASIYAPEARLNTVKFQLSNDMESSISGLYIAGDMSGRTNSFAQAGCSGLAAARHIIKNFKSRRKPNVRVK